MPDQSYWNYGSLSAWINTFDIHLSATYWNIITHKSALLWISGMRGIPCIYRHGLCSSGLPTTPLRSAYTLLSALSDCRTTLIGTPVVCRQKKKHHISAYFDINLYIRDSLGIWILGYFHMPQTQCYECLSLHSVPLSGTAAAAA